MFVDPSAAPTFQIRLGDETRTLTYGFRAFKILGISPFRPQELADYFGEDLQKLDADKAAAWVRAGMAWEYAKGRTRHGQDLPDVEDLIDFLDLPKFMDVFNLSVHAAGLDGKPDPSEGKPETTDPTTA